MTGTRSKPDTFEPHDDADLTGGTPSSFRQGLRSSTLVTAHSDKKDLANNDNSNNNENNAGSSVNINNANANVNAKYEADLWSEYTQCRTEKEREICRERIVKRYLPLIKYVVNRMAATPPSGLDYEDLWSFGIFGLLDAIDRFDPSKGFSFQTYAVPRIRGAILDELRKCDWFSRTGREKVQSMNRAMEKVLRDHGHLDNKKIMAEMGIDEKAFYEIQELAGRGFIISLDEPTPLEDGDVSIEATLADDREGTQERLEREDEHQQLLNAIKQLPERDQQVLSFYYYENLSLKEIGRVLGVTESRVSQIHGHALSALRAILRTKKN